MSELADFTRLVAALDPWLDRLVFIGGWAHRLYRLHGSAVPPDYAPLFTRDADVAFAPEDRLQGDIGKRLADAGFVEVLSGEHRPPVTHYALGDDENGFYAEFLTVLHGAATRRSGDADATIATAGITAQKLRHLGILLVAPWTVRIEGHGSVRIPNPMAFIVQKALIARLRKPDKRAQDALYVHDTLELFAQALPMLRSTWMHDVAPSMRPADRTKAVAAIKAMFAPDNDTPRDAVAMRRDRDLDPMRFRRFALAAIDVVFE